MNINAKRARQEALRALLEAGESGDQAHLLKRLGEKGIATTQATISRDLREMGYVKVSPAPGEVRYESLDHPVRTETGRRSASPSRPSWWMS